MRSTSRRQDLWFITRVVVAGFLAAMLLVINLPAAGANPPAHSQAGGRGNGAPVEESTEDTTVTAESTEPVVDPTEPVVDPTEPVVDPTEAVVDPTEAVVDPTDPVVDPTEPVVDPTEASFDATVASSQQLVAAAITGAGGDYTFDWKAADPALYPHTNPALTPCPTNSRGSGAGALPGADYSTGVSALTPTSMVVGQIVAFELSFTADGDAPLENGVNITAAWGTQTSNGSPYGYDGGQGVVCAFVDTSDSSNTSATAEVASVTTATPAAGEFRRTIEINKLERGKTAIVEVWVVLQSTLPVAALNGQIEAKNIRVSADDDDSVVTTANKAIPLRNLNQAFLPVLSVDKMAVAGPNGVWTDASVSSVAHGDTFEYLVRVTNSGSAAQSLTFTVTDQVPSQLTVGTPVLDGGAAGTCSKTGNAVSCDITEDLAVNASVVVRIPVTAPSTGCVIGDNTASITGGATSTPAVSMTLNCAPDLDIEKKAVASGGLWAAADKTSVDPGLGYDYLVRVTNNGSGPQSLTFTVTDQVPSQLTVGTPVLDGGAAGTCSKTGNAVSCDITEDLAVNASVVVRIPVTAPSTGCVIGDNTASITGGATSTPAVSMTLNCAPDLDIEKKAVASGGLWAAADKTSVDPGLGYDYLVRVTNNGSGPQSLTFTVTDQVPSQLTVGTPVLDGGAAGTCSKTGNAVSCDITEDLAVNASVVVRIPVTAPSTGCVIGDNTASITGGATSTPAVSMTLNCAPDLDIEKKAVASGGLWAAADKTSVDPGLGYDYLVRVTNNGSGPQSLTFTVTDQVPSQLTVGTPVLDGGAAGTCSKTGNAVSCDITEDLAVNASVVVRIPVTAPSTGCVIGDNTASITGGATSTPAVSMTLNCAPDLDIEKKAVASGGLWAAADKTSVDPGLGYDYLVRVTNNGSGPQSLTFTVTDQVPSQLTVGTPVLDGGAAGTCSKTGNAVSCDITEDLAVNASVVVRIPVTAPSTGCVIGDNTASITGGATSTPAVSMTLNCVPDLDIEKKAVASGGLWAAADKTSVDPGLGYDYLVRVTNNGSGPQSLTFTVTDQVPSQLTVGTPVLDGGAAGTCSKTGNAVSCDITEDLAVNASVVVRIPVTAPSTGCVIGDNTASITGGATSTPAVSMTLNCAPDFPPLSKTASKSPVSSTETFTYTISTQNTGSGPATGMSISDDLDDDLTVVSALYQVGTPPFTGVLPVACDPVGAGNTITCDGIDIPVNDTVLVTITVTATPAACGTVTNTARSNQAADSNPIDVTVNCPNPPNPPNNPPTLTPGVEVVKTASAPNPDIGGTIVYTYVVQNVGQLTLTTVTLTDDKLGDIVLPVGSLSPGGQTTVTASHVITRDDLDAGSITNVATTRGLTPGGTPITDTDTVTVDLPQRPDISLTKVGDKEIASVGETVNYEYVITNTGNVTLTDLSLIDDEIPGAFASAVTTTLRAGESMTLDAQDIVEGRHEAIGELTNVAVVRGYYPMSAAGASTKAIDPDATNFMEKSATYTVAVPKTVVQGTGFITVNKDVEGEPGDNGYAFTVDCGGFALGDRNESFSIGPDGGTKEIGVAVPTGTTCTITEVRDGGADETTVQKDSGRVRDSNSIDILVEDGTTEVTFVNTFDAAPVDGEEPEPRPLKDPEKEPTLPATGTDANIQLLLGLAALAMGGTMVRVARPKRRTGWLRG